MPPSPAPGRRFRQQPPPAGKRRTQPPIAETTGSAPHAAARRSSLIRQETSISRLTEETRRSAGLRAVGRDLLRSLTVMRFRCWT
jgi:hypothetical protein